MLKSEKWIWLSVGAYLICSTMTFSMTYMTEVLYIPVSLVLLYLLYRLLLEPEKNTRQQKVGLLLGIGVFWVIAYFTKEIALVFPVALLGYYFLLRFFPGERTKEARKTGLLGLLLLGIMILAAVGLYLWSNTNSQYYQLGFDSAFFATHWKYFLFGILFYVIVSMIALFVFPVIFPGILWKELEEREKKWYLFLLLLVLVTAAVVSYTIYIYEDYPSMTPKAHVRYVEYLTVPFLILLFSLLEKNKIPALRWWQWGR
jgi:hypothetical protein